MRNYIKSLISCVFICILFIANLFMPISYKNAYLNTFCFGSQLNKITYAKILDDCILYKNSTMNNDISNIYFYLPTTYFVSILNYQNSDIVKVQYSQFIGYCYTQFLSAVTFTPNTQTLENITFDINPLAGTQIWSLPTDINSTKYTTIPAGSTNIEYVSYTIGIIPTGGTSNIWYYARFTPPTNTTRVYEGYIYSESTTNLSNITNNLEEEILIEEKLPLPNTITISSALKIVLIIFICIPFAILFLISTIKTIKEIKLKKQVNKKTIADKKENYTAHSNINFIKKPKSLSLSKPNDELETIEVSFPQYDYIDDDDLL